MTRNRRLRVFGPYPSAGAIRESLSLLQKTFMVRQCEDSYFKNRTRPCLQYQIKRCKGPCVGLVEPEVYAQDVRHSVMFLEGRSSALTEELGNEMEQAASTLTAKWLACSNTSWLLERLSIDDLRSDFEVRMGELGLLQALLAADQTGSS